MKLSRFEDIDAWQEARLLVRSIYKAIGISSDFTRDYRLSGQIQAAAVSIMANIAEGFSRRSKKEFIQFLFVSKSSAAEVQSHLYVALDQNYITRDIFNSLYNQAEKIARMNAGFIKYLNSQLKQPK